MIKNNMLYRQVVKGRRVTYEPACEDAPWFPAPGLWLVEDLPAGKSQCCFVSQQRIADVPDPLPLAALERHRETIGNVVWECMDRWQQGTPMSVNEIVDAVLQAVAEKMGKEKSA